MTGKFLFTNQESYLFDYVAGVQGFDILAYNYNNNALFLEYI